MPIAAYALNNILKHSFMKNINDNENDYSITTTENAMLDEILQSDPLSNNEINLKSTELDDVDDDGDFFK